MVLEILNNAFGIRSLLCPVYFIVPLLIFILWLRAWDSESARQGRWPRLKDKLRQNRGSMWRDFQLSLTCVLLRTPVFILEVWLFALTFKWGDRLAGSLGFDLHLHWPPLLEGLLLTLGTLLIGDLTTFLLHREMHRNRFLWPIHSIHHQASFLTPLASYRLHPLEFAGFDCARALTLGLTMGAFYAIFDNHTPMVAVGGVGAGVILWQLSANLQHFPIGVRYPRFLGLIFLSPHLHHLHHNLSREFFDANYGAIFSFWDRIWGSYKEFDVMGSNADRLSGDILAQSPGAHSASLPPARTYWSDLLYPLKAISIEIKRPDDDVA